MKLYKLNKEQRYDFMEESHGKKVSGINKPGSRNQGGKVPKIL